MLREGGAAGSPRDRHSRAIGQCTARGLDRDHGQENIVGLGALQSVTFKGVGADESDIYQLKFEKGSLEWRIWLSADGSKLLSARVRPVASP